MIVKSRPNGSVVGDGQLLPADEWARREVEARPLVQRRNEFGIRRGLIGRVGPGVEPEQLADDAIDRAVVALEEDVVREVVHAHVNPRAARGVAGIQRRLVLGGEVP